jgi:hypothetical protein
MLSLSLHAKSSSLCDSSFSLLSCPSTSGFLPHSSLHSQTRGSYGHFLHRKRAGNSSKRALRGKTEEFACGKGAFGIGERRNAREKGDYRLTLAPISKQCGRKVLSKSKVDDEKRDQGRLQTLGTTNKPRQKLQLARLKPAQTREIDFFSPNNQISAFLGGIDSPALKSKRECADLSHKEVSCIYVPSPYTQKDLFPRLIYCGNAVSTHITSLRPIYIGHLNDYKPVIVLYFDGVLGDFYKRSLNDTSPNSIRLRENVELGLQWLQLTSHLVFITGMSRRKALRVISYFHTAHVTFKAAYLVPIASEVVDYSAILADLKVNLQELLAVSSLDVAYEDLKDASEESLYVKSGTKIRLLANALPVIGQNSPTTLLIPSLKSQNPNEHLAFDQIASSIQSLRKGANWQSAFESVISGPMGDMRAVRTALVAEAVLERTLKMPRAEAVRKAVGRVCGLHRTLAVPETVPIFSSSLIILTQLPTHNSKCTLLESKALHLKSGFLNLLDYTTSKSSPLSFK